MQQAQLYGHKSLLLALDLRERAAVAAFFAAMARSFFRSWQEGGSIVGLIMLLSESSVVVFVLIRRSTSNVSVRPPGMF